MSSHSVAASASTQAALGTSEVEINENHRQSLDLRLGEVVHILPCHWLRSRACRKPVYEDWQEGRLQVQDPRRDVPFAHGLSYETEC